LFKKVYLQAALNGIWIYIEKYNNRKSGEFILSANKSWPGIKDKA
jgi:hypothetical protein